MDTTRRKFIQTVSLATMASAFAQEGTAHLPIAFSTLGCPAWDLAKILDFANKNGFAAVELRGLQGNLDLPSHPVFAAQNIEATKRLISAQKVRLAASAVRPMWERPIRKSVRRD